MPDGKALQSGTSHFLGQNFAKAFGIKFQSREGAEELGWSTSWGVSTRLVGALIMVHGDQRGLALPPMVAPHQVVVIPVAAHKEGVSEKCADVAGLLSEAGLRVRLDNRDTVSPGWKFNEWELKGVPLRLEIGPRDIENGVAMSMRRDTLEKAPVALDGIAQNVKDLLAAIQRNMYDKATAHLEKHIFDASTMPGMQKGLDEGLGYVRAHWCGDVACEQAVKEQFSATSRCIRDDEMKGGSSCVVCGKPAEHLVYWAKAY